MGKVNLNKDIIFKKTMEVLLNRAEKFAQENLTPEEKCYSTEGCLDLQVSPIPMTNEVLILKSLDQLYSSFAQITLIQAGFSAVLSTRIPTLNEKEKQQMSDGAVSLTNLSLNLSKQQKILNKTLQDFEKALKEVQDLKVGQN